MGLEVADEGSMPPPVFNVRDPRAFKVGGKAVSEILLGTYLAPYHKFG